MNSKSEIHNEESIIIVDFGSQFSHLIARRLREINIYSILISPSSDFDALKRLNPKGIILSGGPYSVYDTNAPLAPDWVYTSNLPILGICYGMQLITHQLNGKVTASSKREYGHAKLNKKSLSTTLLDSIDDNNDVWMSHGDKIDSLPIDFECIASTENTPFAVIRKDNIYGLQFHPEVSHTNNGIQILKNFVYKICGCEGKWTPENFITKSVNEIKEIVGEDTVICALSGGVDSSVTARLIHEAIGDQLQCIFVNNGLLRKDESKNVIEAFEKFTDFNLTYINAERQFLKSLKNIIDPEEKRKIIGTEFINIFEEYSKNNFSNAKFLAQGTLYPDVIESESNDNSNSAKIKTHHNVGGLPEKMSLKLLEPLRYLFKDEVKNIGKSLGLSEELLYRQPFPGPGLSIRILGEVTKEKLDILRDVDWIVIDEIKAANLYHSLWQSFAVLTNAKSVGVMGDHRTYSYVVAIRAVQSDDAMTANWAKIPYEVLSTISNRIVNEVPSVNRVVYDITSKPPGTIEWE